MGQLIEFANNNMLLVAGTVLMALAVVFYELRRQADSVSAISAAQAVRLINQGARVLDIRDKAKFDGGHIIDAVNMPTTDIKDDDAAKLKKAKSVILVCDSGAESARHVAVLKKSGIENAFSLQGGLAGWQRDNLPVVASEAAEASQKKSGKKHAPEKSNGRKSNRGKSNNGNDDGKTDAA